MDHMAAKKNKGHDQPAAASPPRPSVTAEAVVKKKPTTLLDAYEVECIRRELERLVVKQTQKSVAGKGGGETAVPGAVHGHHLRHHASKTTTTTSASKVKVSPSTAASAGKTTKGARRGGGVRLLGRHAVAICSGAAPVSAAGGGRRRGGYREVEKVQRVTAHASLTSTSARGVDSGVILGEQLRSGV